MNRIMNTILEVKDLTIEINFPTICWRNSLPPKAKWLKTIIAFANGAGRELILVVDNKSRDIVRNREFFMMIKMR